MKPRVFVIIAVCAITGCYPERTQMHKEKAADPPAAVISVDEAVGGLPCFKCHSYKEFTNEPQEGIFSHQLHLDTEYHCNQCHDVAGHRHVIINKGICGGCHDDA